MSVCIEVGFLRTSRFLHTRSKFRSVQRMASSFFRDKIMELDQDLPIKSHIMFHETVSSTMDSAKEIVRSYAVKKHELQKMFTVVADFQTKARGTKGRTWKCGNGNLFMTIAIHRSLIPLPLHFLPLRVGTLLMNSFKPFVTKYSSEMKLKWPNDILINGQKLCGVLIEMEDDHLLIGIGCNIMEAPEVPSTGSDRGRSSTALIYHNEDIEHHRDSMLRQIDSGSILYQEDQHDAYLPLHRLLAKQVVHTFEQWVDSGADSASLVITDFSHQMDFSQQIIRDKLDEASAMIAPMYLNDDGTLHARYIHDNSEIDLVAEYLH